MIRLLGCVLLFGGTLTLFLEQNNRLTKLRMELPHLQQELATGRDREQVLQVELERQESPDKLLEWARRPEFSHLEYPVRDEVVDL